MQVAIKTGKCRLLLLIGIFIAILWVYCHGFLPREFYGGKAINPDAERLGGMVTLAMLFAAPAWPINRLFPVSFSDSWVDPPSVIFDSYVPNEHGKYSWGGSAA